MFITRQHPSGARPLKGYPIGADPQSGKFGYKIGYCPCGCKEPIFIRTIDLNDVLSYFGYTADRLEKSRSSPITRLKKYIIESLGGTSPTL